MVDGRHEGRVGLERLVADLEVVEVQLADDQIEHRPALTASHDLGYGYCAGDRHRDVCDQTRQAFHRKDQDDCFRRAHQSVGDSEGRPEQRQ